MQRGVVLPLDATLNAMQIIWIAPTTVSRVDTTSQERIVNLASCNHSPFSMMDGVWECQHGVWKIRGESLYHRASIMGTVRQNIPFWRCLSFNRVFDASFLPNRCDITDDAWDIVNIPEKPVRARRD